MTIWIILLTLLSLICYNNSNEKPFNTCFKHFGCINFTSEWFDVHHRPYNLPPLERHIVNTKFLLMTAAMGSNTVCYDLFTSNPESVNLTNYNSYFELMVLIHDFTSNGYTGWIKHMALELSERDSHNIVSVDWQEGAEPPYNQAISNARIVAIEIEKFLSLLIKYFALHLGQIHLMGHGVGAHIAGYVGKAFHGKIIRITALDPSGPQFEGMPPVVRLDYTDAFYVEVLHTDGHYQGAMQPFGNIDFYFNQGISQPGCSKSTEHWDLEKVTRDNLKEGSILPGCSHKRAYKYYLESFHKENCIYLGLPINTNVEDPISCVRHEHKWTCTTFGIEINGKDYSHLVNEKYEIITSSCSPFCLNRYQIRIDFVDCPEAEKEATGYFIMVLHDLEANKLNITFNLSKNESHVVELGHNVTFPAWTRDAAIDRAINVSVTWHFTTPFCYHCRNATCVSHFSVAHIRTYSGTGDKPLASHFCAPSPLPYLVLRDHIQENRFIDCTAEL